MKQTIDYLESFAVMALIAMGLTGAAYHLFRDGGLMESAGSTLWSFITESPLLAFSAIVCSVVITRLWKHSRQFQRHNAKVATAVFYMLMGAGTYFVGRLLLVGTL